MSTLATKTDSPAELADRRLDQRADRYAALSVLWEISKNNGRRKCRRVGVLPGGVVQVKVTGVGADRRAGFGGLATCGSVWSCPVCADRVLTARQQELNTAFTAWSSTGGRIAFVTLTMRHRRNDGLAGLWDDLGAAWHAVTSGRAWEGLQARFGSLVTRTVTRGSRKGEVILDNRVPYLRTVEVTHGANGWHVHIHAAFFLPADADLTSVHLFGQEVYGRWAHALDKLGRSATLDGFDARLWDGGLDTMSEYLAKNTYRSAEQLSMELARGGLKIGRRESRTPLQILASITSEFLAPDGRLWSEWEAASSGRRHLTWSVGLRGLVGLDHEMTDEEIAAADDLSGDVVLDLPSRSVRKMGRLGLHAAVLHLAEVDDGGRTLRGFLAHHRISWLVPEDRPDVSRLRPDCLLPDCDCLA